LVKVRRIASSKHSHWDPAKTGGIRHEHARHRLIIRLPGDLVRSRDIDLGLVVQVHLRAAVLAAGALRRLLVLHGIYIDLVLLFEEATGAK